jgi:demethylmenaquinone methyltransferase/2-methoxy-6-polyprenyl-1,4-benzoquinol methylase
MRDAEMTNDEELLAEQRAYYRARAPEYDDWWQRRGPYDRGLDEVEEWDRQIAVVDAALTAFDAGGRVLELAGGTGWWTERLARTADQLTVVDASPETVELNQARVRRADVRYVVADLFDWRPDQRYDVVFFSFWLSHVPRGRFSSFWALVASSLTRGGRAFLVDNRTTTTPAPKRADPHAVEYGRDLHRRRLSDGSEYRVIKVLYEPDQLERALAAEGWQAEIDATRWFIFGWGQPRPGG